MGHVQRIKASFETDYSIHWGSLTFFNNSMILLNISLFFATGLVKQGYYFTYLSLLALVVVQLMILVPVAKLGSLRYYLVALLLELVSCYFIVASVVFWIQNQ